MVTPNHTKIIPVAIVATTRAGAEISRTSSMTPTTRMSAAPKRTPIDSLFASNKPPKRSMRHASANATTTPANIAIPPTSGVGMVCTFRSPGMATQFFARAKARTRGVVRKVTNMAHAPIIR